MFRQNAFVVGGRGRASMVQNAVVGGTSMAGLALRHLASRIWSLASGQTVRDSHIHASADPPARRPQKFRPPAKHHVHGSILSVPYPYQKNVKREDDGNITKTYTMIGHHSTKRRATTAIDDKLFLMLTLSFFAGGRCLAVWIERACILFYCFIYPTSHFISYVCTN